MFRFVVSCFAAFGAFVAAISFNASPPVAIGASVVAFFITNGLGD
jgi:hypothetical protein